MSAEEEIECNVVNEEPVSIEEQLAPENAKPTKLNKNGKPRKVLSPEALEKLRLAREKANAIRKESYTKKLEEKVEKLKETKSCNPIAEEIPEQKIIEKPKPKGNSSLLVDIFINWPLAGSCTKSNLI